MGKSKMPKMVLINYNKEAVKVLVLKDNGNGTLKVRKPGSQVEWLNVAKCALLKELDAPQLPSVA